MGGGFVLEEDESFLFGFYILPGGCFRKCVSLCFGFEPPGIPFRELLNCLFIAFFTLFSSFFSGASKKHNINSLVKQCQKRCRRQYFRDLGTVA